MNYYISDLHLGHYNVLRFDGRPFNTCSEMEDTIIKNWNSVVKKEDTVYILGDYCWNTDEEWERTLKLLNGNKVLWYVFLATLICQVVNTVNWVAGFF